MTEIVEDIFEAKLKKVGNSNHIVIPSKYLFKKIYVMIVNDKITSINLYLTTNLTYTPIELQGVTWAISFSIIERENVVYKPLTDLLISNLPPPPQDQPKANMTPEEVAKLEKEYQDNLTKLEEYKKRIESRKLK